MKILFVVSGIGYGDATREHANIEAIRARFPEAKIKVAGYDNSYNYFKDKYHTLRIKGYKLPGESMRVSALHFGLKNIFLPAFWFIGTLKVRLQAFNFIPDIIVSDFEPIGISLAKVLNKKCVVIFGFDPDLYKSFKKKRKVNYKLKTEAAYFTKLYDQSQIVLIPTFKQRRKEHLRYTYINPIVRANPKDLPSEKVLMQALGLKKKPILVNLGGSTLGNKLAKYINRIAPKFEEDFIILGGSVALKHHSNVTYIRYTEDVLKYLKICKGVITLAGQQTLAEALTFNKAVLSFPIEDHIEQALNAFALEKTIMVSYKHDSKSVEKAVASFVKNISFIEKKVKALAVKGDGAETVAKLIDVIK